MAIPKVPPVSVQSARFAWTWLLAVGALVSLTGCMSPDVYRDGAIQTAYVSTTVPVAGSPGKKLVVRVENLTESRRERKETQNLWLCCVPIACCWSCWERPNWLLWDESYYGGYKPAGRDIAELLAKELRKANLFESVSSGSTENGADLLLQGDVRDLTFTYRPHLLGMSAIVGPWITLLGFPVGNWSITQTLDLRLIEVSQGGTLWEQTFVTQDGGVVAAYYGKDPMRCGYPADTLIAPVVKQVVAETEKALAAKSESYWNSLVALRPRNATRPVAPEEPSPPPVVVAPPRHLETFPPLAPVAYSDNSSVAVVIGISEYATMGKIRACKSDAEVFADAFGRARGMNPDNVILMTDGGDPSHLPTRSMIEDRIRICAKEAKADGMALVYFSGHAVTQNGQPVLVPKDCRPETGIPLSEITALLKESKARDKVLIIDACHAGAEQKGILVVERKSLPEAPGVAMFFSCSQDESSYETEDGQRSVYTDVFLRCLQDAAADSSAITARSLQDRIEEKMRAWRLRTAKQQTPQLMLTGTPDVILVPKRP